MMKQDAEHLARHVADLCLERKALDVVAIDLRGLGAYTDFLVIGSGTSDRHVQAICEFVERTVRTETGTHPVGTEGLREGQWALVDFGSVVVHVFHQFTRSIYDLDALWDQAPRLVIEPQAANTGS